MADGDTDRLAYARDLWPRHHLDVRAGEPGKHRPGAIVWPERREDVAELARFASRHGVPLVPFGAGSGVCGAVLPTSDTIVVDLKRLRDWRVLPGGQALDVGPGALGITLEEDLQRGGHTIGHFPSSILCSTVGGWIAARGAGQCSGLYGKIEDMVLDLELVTGDGEVVTLRRRRTAPDLVPLVVGSEGTFGFVTRATLRLHPLARERVYQSFTFPTIEAGWSALRRLFQEGLRPAVSRLYDPIDSAMMKQGSVRKGGKAGPRKPGAGSSRRAAALRQVARHALALPRLLNGAIQAAEGNLLGGCTLVLVFEGAPGEARADAARAERACVAERGAPLGDAPALRWWQHRYSVSYRQAPVFRLGAFSDTMEVAAPWSRLGELYHGVRRALGRHVLVMAHLSHAYPDGCSIYFTFSGAAADDQAALALYDRAWRSALGAAIAAGGTLSHHHGVGRSKAPALGQELGHGVLVVRQLMSAFDPSGVMNPGNLAPRDALPGAPVPTAVPGIDAESLTVTALGTRTLSEVQRELAARDLTLRITDQAPRDATLARWIADGMPGARDAFADPVSQALVGARARLRSGALLEVRPAPRRAVGPDLLALLTGARERVAVVEQATLAVTPRSGASARELPLEWDRDPAQSATEAALWERVARAVH